MHFKTKSQYNPDTERVDNYLTLVESFRDKADRVRKRTVMTVGYQLSGLRHEDIRDIAKALTQKYDNRAYDKDLFGGDGFGHWNDTVLAHARALWAKMLDEGAIDASDEARRKADAECREMVRARTIRHTDAREAGAEWLCLQAVEQLRLREFLEGLGWSEAKVNAALSVLVTRTVYSPSELATRRIMEENSAVCELVSGDREWMPSLRSIYDVAPSLYAVKEELERHLCNVTDNLFNLHNRIVLFDLTNFYFEGRKAGSKKAKFGRSKEKRGDCRLLVLALCINTDGFIRYSSILEGNTADPKSLPDMVERLMVKSPVGGSDRALVVMDAGIATNENLALLKEKGYNYLCVSRTKLKDYELRADSQSVTVYDSRRQPITLHEVRTEPDGDYLLEITSPTKAMTEASMNRQWRERFEEEMEKINLALGKKGGVKTYEKVIERVGRAVQKYPSISKYYDITYTRSEEKPRNMGRVEWKVSDLSGIERGHGVYFLRTNVRTLDEKTTWDYYNLIREIECTNRQLKTDLNLRPIYHQTDGNSDAHIFLGLLAYWIVNTVRLQLKRQGENAYWTEIVRRMSSQKLITTEGINPFEEKVIIRKFSEPTAAAASIYSKLGYRHQPFRRKMEICSTHG